MPLTKCFDSLRVLSPVPEAGSPRAMYDRGDSSWAVRMNRSTPLSSLLAVVGVPWHVEASPWSLFPSPRGLLCVCVSVSTFPLL